MRDRHGGTSRPDSLLAERDPREVIPLGLIGFGAGAGGLAAGYYDLSVWAWLALGAIAVLAGTLLARPARLDALPLAALAGLGAYAAWALASTMWAESADAALIDGLRWAFYATVFAAVLLLVRTESGARTLVAAVGVGASFAGLALVVRLLVDGSGQFLEGRLNEPMEYINGEAAALLIPVWPLVAVAERTSSPTRCGAAVAGATLCTGLATLTQSRGAILAASVSVVVLLILVPGRVRRMLLAGTVAATVALLAIGPLADLSGPELNPTDARVREAVAALIGSALGIGLGWALALRKWLGAADAAKTTARRAGVLTVGVAGLVILVGAGGRLAALPEQISEEYTAFTELQPVSETRLLSGGGNRYDYWRVAWGQFTDDPVRGAGAGSFQTDWYRERRTPESIRQAHSVVMQTLGDMGIVGALSLACFLAACGIALVRRSRRNGAYEPGIAVAAGGILLIWLVHTSVDWLHLIPALAVSAVCAAAALLGPSAGRVAPTGTGRQQKVLLLVVLPVLLVLAVFLLRSVLALHAQSEGYAVLETDPRAALERAGSALEMNPQSMESHYLAAAAFARLNDYESAKLQLEESIELEPSDHVPWVLLGDLETRRGNTAAARRSYRRAATLNPLDASIKALASGAAPGTPGSR